MSKLLKAEHSGGGLHIKILLTNCYKGSYTLAEMEEMLSSSFQEEIRGVLKDAVKYEVDRTKEAIWNSQKTMKEMLDYLSELQEKDKARSEDQSKTK